MMRRTIKKQKKKLTAAIKSFNFPTTPSRPRWYMFPRHSRHFDRSFLLFLAGDIDHDVVIEI